VVAVILAVVLVACAALVETDPSNKTTLPKIPADTFFTGCAYLDQDGDGIADRDEDLIGGLLFEVTLAGGTGFGSETTDGRCAVVTVPSGLQDDAWPVVVRMVVPEAAEVKPVGSGKISLQYPETRAEFLFVSR
jgi:hypothetical protein